MEKEPVRISIFTKEEDSWDTGWKWSWFTKDIWISKWLEEEQIVWRPLFSLLSKLKVKSILDCSCGFGIKTVLLAKIGYKVEGSDGSAVAVRYAQQFAKEQGVNIRFFRSRWEDLGKKCKRTYDCVFSDYFDGIKTSKIMRESAKGIYSILKKNGKFIFCGVLPKWSKLDLKKLIEKEWKIRKQFEILPPYNKGGVRVINLEFYEKTLEGILQNSIFLIEEQGVMRAEVTITMNPQIKWTWQDYNEALKEAGFRKVECIKKEGMIFNIGIK